MSPPFVVPRPIRLLRLAAALLALAVLPWVDARARLAEEFLLPEDAFKASGRPLDEHSLELVFDIAPGYYLYREQFHFSATGATLGTPRLPPGAVKFDETFRKDVETYRGRLRVAIPVLQATPSFLLQVDYQGCADRGLCYPPAQWKGTVGLLGFGGNASVMTVGLEASGSAGNGGVVAKPEVAAVERWQLAAALGAVVLIAAVGAGWRARSSGSRNKSVQ